MPSDVRREAQGASGALASYDFFDCFDAPRLGRVTADRGIALS